MHAGTMSRIPIYPHVSSSGRGHVAPVRDIRLPTGCPIGRGSRKYVRRQKIGPPVNTRDPTFARIFGPLYARVARRDARRRDAWRGEAMRRVRSTSN